MKKLFLIITVLLPAIIFAQPTASLTVFSENEDKFYLFLDGIKQNDVPRSNMRIVDLPDLYYSAKIIFEDAALWPVSKNNLYVSDGDDIMRDASYRLKRDKTGRPKLNFYSMAAVRQNFVVSAGMYVVHFGQPGVVEPTAVAEVKPVPDKTFVSTAGSLTVFSQNDDPFFLYLDGVKQNGEARSNVCIRQIPGLYYNARIVFKDSRLAPIVKNNLFISDGDDNLMDAAYRIRRDKTGKPKLNFYSMKTVQPDFKAAPGMFVYDFGNSTPANKFATNNPANSSTKTATPVSGATRNITTTDPPFLKKAVEKNNAPTKSDKALEKTKATPGGLKKQDQPHANVAKNSSAETVTVTENKKCNGWPMGKGDLAAAKKIIEDAAKDDEKLAAAQEIIASNCLLVSQVSEFCNMFKSEKSKLAFAKYAYKFTIDRKNYREVTKALSLETSKKELNKFISGG